jgi:hypothetical protein
MDKKVKVTLEDATIADYHELAEIFHTANINTEIVTQNTTGSEMGLGFDELVVLFPLVVPFVVQFRKVLVAYFTYKKPLNKKISITLEHDGKKLKIESENESIPSIEQFMGFFTED